MSEVTIRISAVDNASQTLRKVASAMDSVKTTAGGADGKTGGLAGAMNMLGREIQTAVLGFGMMKLGQTILDMRDLGQNVGAAERAFVELNGGTREAAATLAAMRQTTRGVVNDYDLMMGANRLLMMGLAGNTEEVARLTRVAVELGRVMGKDAAQSIEDFSLLLSNRSILRLDNFGISSARVRDRLEELKKAGLGLEEAFSLAVLEEGEDALRRLGDAAGASASAWDQLMTKISGVKEELAEVVFQAGETLAKLILIIDYSAQLNARRQQEEREAWAGYTQETVAMSGNAPGAFTAGLVAGGATPEDAATIARSMGMTGEQLAAIVASIQAMQQEGAPLAGMAPEEAIYQYQWMTGQTLTAPVQQAVLQVLTGGGVSAEAAARRAQELVTRQQYGWGSQRGGFAAFYEQEAAAQQQLALARPAQAAATQQQYGWGARRAEFAEFYAQEAAAQQQAKWLARMPQYPQPADIRGTRVYGLGYELTPLELRARREGAWTPTPEQLRASQWAQWNLQQSYASVGAMGEYQTGRRQEAAQMGLDLMGNIFNRGMDFFHGAVERAQDIHDAMRQAGIEARRIPETLKEWLSLGKPGGLRGELYEEIAKQMEKARSETEGGEFLRGVGMINWRDELISMLAGMAPAQAIPIAQAVGSWMEAGGQAESVTEAMAGAGFYRAGVGGEAYTVQAGDTVSGLAARFNLPQETIMRQLGITDPRRLRAGATMMTGADEWQRLPLYMTGGYGGVKMAEEEEARGPADGVQEAIDKIAEMREALDEAMTTPRTVPVMLQFAADLEAMNPVLRPMVERILADLLRNRSVGTTGGAATMRTTASGMRVR